MNKKEWLEDFVDNLKKFMEKKHINQTELARQAHLSRMTISRYLSCQQVPSAIALVNISYVFECDIEDLVWTYDLIEE